MPITKYFEKIEILKVAIDSEELDEQHASNAKEFVTKANLDSESLKDPSHRRTIEEQATDLITQFEASHPKVSAALHEVVAALQAIGI